MGDFTGFTFGGVHTSSLGITRVSGGDRYNEELFPEIKDVTAEVPGVNGEYYFGSNYGPKKIDIEVAFDSLTEAQFRELRKVFSTKDTKQLIFNERPYKKYMAKLESPIELSYICFDEPKKTVGTERDGIRVVDRTTTTSTEEIDGEEVEVTTTTIARERVTPYVIDYTQTQRIYKGEGKMTFVCYFPFARSVYKVLPEESNDWAISSGILSAEDYELFDSYDSETGIIKIYNAGDIETGFRLYLPGSVVTTATTLNYKRYDVDINPTASLVLNAMTLNDGDEGVLVDTINELIVGVSSFGHDSNDNAIYITSGNIYNEYVDSGYFFHLEPCGQYDGTLIEITGGAEGIEIFYDYLYF